MDLFLKLSDDAKRLLWLVGESGKGIVDQITKLHNQNQWTTKLEIIRSTKKSTLSVLWVKELPVNAVAYRNKKNPFKTALWKKMKTVNKFKNNNSDDQVSIPPEKDLDSELSEGVAYVVPGYTEAGSFADAKTLVAYNGKLCVIKSSDELVITELLFEIITQAYLFEQIRNRPRLLEEVKAYVKQQAGVKVYVPHKVADDGAIYKKIKVPELFFVQRFAAEDDGDDVSMIDVERVTDVDICMCRAEGVPLKILGTSRLMISLAHVCKALWHLQRDFHFMHRDLSGHNVFFDYASKSVTFIDFGMSCVNPDLHRDAWQSGNDDFYKQTGGESYASKCTNMSLDICVLISFLTHSGTHAWCNVELVEMQKKMKETIAASENETAKAKLTLIPSLKAKLEDINNTVLTDKQRRSLIKKAIKRAVVDGQSYTALDYGEGNPGNMLSADSGPHWWLFNLVEFPIEHYYPVNVLTRLLEHIPIKEWFAIRANWTDAFDAAMPKNIRIGIKDGVAIEQYLPPGAAFIGKEGLLVKLYKTNQLAVKFGHIQYYLDIEICERIV